MVERKTSYEVQTLRDERWLVAEVHDDEAAAKAAAVKLLKRAEVSGVRVVRDWQRRDNRHVERIVFSEAKETRREDRILANNVDTATYCRVEDDYFRLESRLTINRVIRTYLDKQILTPTELLHNHRELRRLSTYDRLVPSSADKIATIQCRETGEDGRARRDAILTAVDNILAKAREAERNPALRSIEGRDFAAAYAALSKAVSSPEIRDYLALVAVSKHLVDNRNWLGKLADLLDSLDGDLDPQAARLLDGVVADVLGSPAVVQELLGWQPSLATALCRLADLSEGTLSVEGRAADDVARLLNRLFAKGILPAARVALLERIHRQLVGGSALSRTEPEAETKAFTEVVDRFLPADGPFGGPATTEAVTRRAIRLVQRGGAPGESDAIAEVVLRLPQVERRVIYLTSLAATPLGRTHISDVLRHLGEITGRASVDQIVNPRLAPTDKAAAITRLYDRIRESPLPEAERQRHGNRLDETLARYLVQEGIIENFDNPADGLRVRAFRLVEFCASGVLTPGKAMALARERVIGHIRKPNFDSELVAGLPSAGEKEKAIRDFFTLLRKAGFQ